MKRASAVPYVLPLSFVVTLSLCAANAPIPSAGPITSNYIHLMVEKEVNRGFDAKGTNYCFEVELHCEESNIEQISLAVNGEARATWVSSMGYYDWTNNVDGVFSEVDEEDKEWDLEVAFPAPTNLTLEASGDWLLTVIRSGGETNTMSFTLSLPTAPKEAADIFLALPEILSPTPFSATNTTPMLTWNCADAEKATYVDIGIEKRTCVTNEWGDWWFDYGQEGEMLFDNPSVTSWTPDPLDDGTWEIWLAYISIPDTETLNVLISNFETTGPLAWAASPYAPAYWPSDGTPLLASISTEGSEFFVGEIEGQSDTPQFSPPSGTTFTGFGMEVSLYCYQPGAAIRYTLDGSEPTVASVPYHYESFWISDTTTVKAKAFVGGMLPSETVTATYTNVVYTLAEALNATYLTFATGGDAPWFVESDTTLNGGEPAAAQSGDIGDRQTSWVETTVTGSGTFSFWWKVSCEDDDLDDWDYVYVSVDSNEWRRCDGEVDWEQIDINIEGIGDHTIRWTYKKDRIESAGRDCAWLDAMNWQPDPTATTTTPVAVPYVWLDDFGLAATSDYETAAFSDTDGDGMAAWEEFVAGTTPTNAASVFLANILQTDHGPQVTWTPDLGSLRVYTVIGKTLLTDADWGATNAASRFFRVQVDFVP